jgi:hypothetical protein
MSERPIEPETLQALGEAAGKRGPALNALLSRLYMMPDDDDLEIAKSIAERDSLEIRLSGKKFHPFLPSPPAEALRALSGILIGRIPNYKEVVRAPVNTHWYVAGTAGSGKTTAVEIATIFAYRSGRNVVVFDSEGQFSADLAGMVRASDLYVFDHESYFVNMFQPPFGCSNEEWNGGLANLNRECWHYRRGAENAAQKVMQAVLSSGRELNMASFWEQLKIEEKKVARGSREWDYFDTVRRATEGLMNFLKGLRVRSSRGLEEVFSRRFVIFDWHRLENAQFRKFLTLHATAWLLASRSGETAHPADTMVVFDEVSQLASKDLSNQSDITEPFFETAMRRARRKGFCHVTLDQNAAFTHPVVRGNSGVKIILLDAQAVRWTGEPLLLASCLLDLSPATQAPAVVIQMRGCDLLAERVVRLMEAPGTGVSVVGWPVRTLAALLLASFPWVVVELQHAAPVSGFSPSRRAEIERDLIARGRSRERQTPGLGSASSISNR